MLAEGEVPGDPVRRRRRHGRRRRGVRGARRVPDRAGGEQLPAQRFVPGQPPARLRAARLPGLEGGDAASSRAPTSCSRSARRLGPFGTLPQHGFDYWPKDAKIIQIDADPRMLGLVKKVSLGICGDARLAARRAAGAAEGARQAARPNKARLAEVQRGEGSLDRGARQLALAQREGPHRPAPGAGRARQGDAEERDGLHRHRQRLLGGELLPALRAAGRRSSRR